MSIVLCCCSKSLSCCSQNLRCQLDICSFPIQEGELLRPRVPALEAEVARLQVEVQDRNKGLRDAQNEEGLARAQVTSPLCILGF